MRRVLVWLLLMGPVGFGLGGLSTAEAAQPDRVGAALHEEAQAMEAFVVAVSEEVRGGLAVSTDARASFDDGVVAWSAAGEAFRREAWGEAFRRSVGPRELMRPLLVDAGESGLRPASARLLKAWVEATGRRVVALEKRMKVYDVSVSARESLLVGRATWDEARIACKEGRTGTCVRKLCASLKELDGVVREIYPDAR